MELVNIGTISIPAIKGEKGDTGKTGMIKNIQINMLEPSQTASARNIGTETEAVLELNIPKGDGIRNVHIDENKDLIITLASNQIINVGSVKSVGIEVIKIEDGNLIVILTDGTTINAGNICDENYYTKDEIDLKFLDIGNAKIYYIDKNTISYNIDLLEKIVNEVLKGKSSYIISSNTYGADLFYINSIRSNTVNSFNGFRVPIYSDTNTYSYVNFNTSQLKITVDEENNVTDVVIQTASGTNYNFLDTNKDYKSPYVPKFPGSPVSKQYVDNLVGNINTILDTINGEVIGEELTTLTDEIPVEVNIENEEVTKDVNN